MNDAIHESLAVSDALALEIQRQVEEGVEKLDWRRLQLVAHRSRRQIDRVFRARFESSPAQYMRAPANGLRGATARVRT
jgi:transcriptional regulator GlxA family with amidase domain